jgi:hypothetical protein
MRLATVKPGQLQPSAKNNSKRNNNTSNNNNNNNNNVISFTFQRPCHQAYSSAGPVKKS